MLDPVACLGAAGVHPGSSGRVTRPLDGRIVAPRLDEGKVPAVTKAGMMNDGCMGISQVRTRGDT